MGSVVTVAPANNAAYDEAVELFFAIAIPAFLLAFGLYAGGDQWRWNADERFGSKNYEPPIELNLNKTDRP
jgi:hypothetical protein